jgi:hypothetical protein
MAQLAMPFSRKADGAALSHSLSFDPGSVRENVRTLKPGPQLRRNVCFDEGLPRWGLTRNGRIMNSEPKKQEPEIMPPVPEVEPEQNVPEIPPDKDAPEKKGPIQAER